MDTIPHELLCVILHEACVVRNMVDINILLVCRKWRQVFVDERIQRCWNMLNDRINELKCVDDVNLFRQLCDMVYRNSEDIRCIRILKQAEVQQKLDIKHNNIQYSAEHTRAMNAARYAGRNAEERSIMMKLAGSIYKGMSDDGYERFMISSQGRIDRARNRESISLSLVNIRGNSYMTATIKSWYIYGKESAENYTYITSKLNIHVPLEVMCVFVDLL